MKQKIESKKFGVSADVNRLGYFGNVNINDLFENSYPHLRVYVSRKGSISITNIIRVSFSTGDITVKDVDIARLSKKQLKVLGNDIEKKYREFVDFIRARISKGI